MMTEQHEPKTTMIRYLLGQMPDHERSNFEEQYQKDAGLFHELVEVENDLIDLYALGALSKKEQEQMSSFLADPDRQKRLEFAKTLTHYPGPAVESVQGKAPESPIPGWVWMGRARFALRVTGAAAAAALIATVSWLLVADRNLRSELEALRNQQSNAVERERALQQEIDTLTRAVQDRTQNTKDAEQAPLLAQNTISFSLGSDVLRGDGPAPTLKIPPTASFVLLDLTLPGHTLHGYDLSLETAEGLPVLRQHANGKLLKGHNTQLAIKLRSRMFVDGDYVLRVTTTADQKVEDLAGYSFRVVRR
jgi:hypothetical protein